jgi:penicillin V acylase-like amidase (Ntn superfamily)
MKKLSCFLRRFFSLAVVVMLTSQVLLTDQALACTTFCLIGKGEVLFGRNYDWMIGDALIFVNKRGVAKTASVGDSTNPAKWVSKYGSVTFNQYGRENPTGGMNEAGLVVEQMWLDESSYPNDSRPSIGTQEWMQYVLDTSATTAEALKNVSAIRIASDVRVHYLINDKDGHTASVEFLNGKLVSQTGNELPIPTLTNDTYEKSISYKRAKSLSDANSSDSLDRFTRASVKTEEFARNPKSEKEAVDYAFAVLSNVAQKGFTQWSIVYDQKRGRVYFRTLQSPETKSIDTRVFDYSCGTAVKMLDINVKGPGDVTAQFVDYTRRANRELIDRSFNGTDFLKDVPARERFGFAAYPETFKCTAP